MTRSHSSVLRPALSLVSVGMVLQQIGLAALVFLLCVVWLRVPDANAIDVCGSVLLAILVLAVAGAGESALMLRLSGHDRTPAKLLRGALVLVVSIALWLLWAMLLDSLRGGDYLRAGYLNSRFPHELRNIFSFAHVMLWLGWMWAALEGIGAGVIALFTFSIIASERPFRTIVRGLLSLGYWIAIVVGISAAAVLTTSLLQWTPGHGLRIEMISLVLRLGMVILVDVTLACLLLAILAVCVHQTDAPYRTPGGTPAESQPRSVDSP